MTHLHIHAPQPDVRQIDRQFCPTCKRRTYFAEWHTGWYGWDSTCLHCGESWQDGERSERPFMPKWRQKSIAAAKARWRTTPTVPPTERNE